MEVAVAVVEPGWGGRSLLREVLPLRKVLESRCVTDYAQNVDYIDFSLHLSEPPAEPTKPKVRIHNQARSLQCRLSLTLASDVSSSDAREAIARVISTGGDAISTFMSGAGQDFDETSFAAELGAALEDYLSEVCE